MIQQSTFNFLKKLKKNNQRDWFDKNKNLYLEAQADMEQLVEKLIAGLSSMDKRIGSDLEAKKCMFRIYRDTRFSKDKTPYKTHLSASINPGGKKEISPGYYVHIQPGNSFVCGGIWMPPPPQLAAIRQEIDYNLDEFKKILGSKEFKKLFGALDPEDRLKTTPKGYAKDHPGIDLLQNKSFIVVHYIDDKKITSKSCMKTMHAALKAMLPLNLFLQRAID